jgi:F-type H+-transporting ATPase subunit b
MVVLDIADLGINLPVLLGQLVTFVFVLTVLRLVVFPPVMNMLDDRRERIREGLNAAERGREQAEQASREAQAQIEAARREGQTLVASAQQVANRITEEARASAQAQADAILERARNEIQLERDSAIAELRREFADLTISAAEKVINQSLDRNAHKRLIEEALAESSFRGN